MSHIQELLENFYDSRHLAIPIERGVPEVVSGNVTRTPTHWLIPCTHTFNSSATEQELEILRIGLEQEPPLALEELLRITNGAELYRIHYPAQNSYWIARYEIFNSNQLLEVNRGLLDTFQSNAAFDKDYCDHLEQIKLDYMAFCHVGDGNFLALDLTSSAPQPIFYLDRYYGAYPYSSHFAKKGYLHVANSLEEWLERLVQSNGQDGTGGVFIPL